MDVHCRGMTPLFESYKEFIPAFDHFQASLREPIPTHLRINTLKADVDWVRGMLEEKGFEITSMYPLEPTLILTPGISAPGNLLEYFLGYIHPQALTSCLAALILNPRPGSYVLDMCAAPGGKTSHMAQLMGNTGLIVANELYASRHVPLGHTLARLGVTNCVITSYQAQQFPLRTKFDYVLADVPCSGEGTFRRIHSRSQYRETEDKAFLPDLQKKILTRGYQALKRGGFLLYSTCTYNPDENEGVVSHLLEKFDAEILPIHADTLELEEGVSQWRDKRYDERVKGAARFYPHRINSVGFFMARIRKPR
ncbi:MAG: RsmB/NOP family class I SAM-dependent RNA methyltransferase [Deltaproteobacteria bacterium]|nr:MAG: RsmB/NOP family class I SAM-dependent RNA methyltransferase [Deltaproteobacteria bacterium]